MKFYLFIAILGISIDSILAQAVCTVSDWDYCSAECGQTGWETIVGSLCGSAHQSQSPIDIVTTGQAYEGAETFTASAGLSDITGQNMSFSYSGSEGRFLLSNDLNQAMTVTIGGVIYVLSHITLTFSNTSNTAGSQHTIDNAQTAVEVGVHFYKNGFGSYDAALGGSSGDVAVFVVFFDIDDTSTTYGAAVTGIVNDAVILSNDNSGSTAVSGSVWTIIEAAAAGDYATYDGSTTTPLCEEVVANWLFYGSILKISQANYDALKSSVGDVIFLACEHNIRSIQPLNSRTVTHHSATQGGSAQNTAHVYSTIAALVFVYVISVW